MKELSPLWATLLLIVLSVILGSVVMSVSDFSDDTCKVEYDVIFHEDNFSVLTNNSLQGIVFTFFDEAYEQTLTIKSQEAFTGMKEFSYPTYFEVKEMEVIPIDETCTVIPKTFTI